MFRKEPCARFGLIKKASYDNNTWLLLYPCNEVRGGSNHHDYEQIVQAVVSTTDVLYVSPAERMVARGIDEPLTMSTFVNRD